MSKYKADPIKQTAIMAQSTMSLAVQLAIAKKDFDMESIKKDAQQILDFEMELSYDYLSKFVKIQEQKIDIPAMIENIESKQEMIIAWGNLNEDEQLQYLPKFNKLRKQNGW